MSTNQTDSAVPRADSAVSEADSEAAKPGSEATKPDSADSKTGSAHPKTDSVVPAEVLELIEESETIQGWMGRLADHADDARPEVLERVKNDYRARLEGVAGQLGEHRPDLAANLEDRQDTVVSLQSDRDSHVADLEEVGLRHAVGEFEEAQWDKHRKRIEAWLEDVDSKLEIENGAVSELSAALDRIDASGPPRASVGSSVAFTSEGFVEVEQKTLGGAGARNSSWSAVVSATKKDGHSDAAGREPTAEQNGSAEKNGSAEDNGAADSDELDFIDAVSTDDLERLDPIAAAMRGRDR